MYLPSRQKNSFTGRKKSFLDWFYPTSANSIAQSSMCCHIGLNKGGFVDSTNSPNRSWKLICHVSWQCHWLLVGLLAKCTGWFFTTPPQHMRNCRPCTRFDWCLAVLKTGRFEFEQCDQTLNSMYFVFERMQQSFCFEWISSPSPSFARVLSKTSSAIQAMQFG